MGVFPSRCNKIITEKRKCIVKFYPSSEEKIKIRIINWIFKGLIGLL